MDFTRHVYGTGWNATSDIQAPWSQTWGRCQSSREANGNSKTRHPLFYLSNLQNNWRRTEMYLTLGAALAASAVSAARKSTDVSLRWVSVYWILCFTFKNPTFFTNIRLTWDFSGRCNWPGHISFLKSQSEQSYSQAEPHRKGVHGHW
jgi:hypothetical protein